MPPLFWPRQNLVRCVAQRHGQRHGQRHDGRGGAGGVSGLGPVVLLPGYARRYVSARGGCVDVHETHGKLELRQNLPVAVFLADRGEAVRLLPVSRVPGVKSPDATRNDVTWEFKVPETSTRNALDKALRDGSKQAPCVLLKLPAGIDRLVLQVALVDRVQRTAAVQAVAVLLGEQLLSFSRQAILTGAFRHELLQKK